MLPLERTIARGAERLAEPTDSAGSPARSARASLCPIPPARVDEGRQDRFVGHYLVARPPRSRTARVRTIWAQAATLWGLSRELRRCGAAFSSSFLLEGGSTPRLECTSPRKSGGDLGKPRPVGGGAQSARRGPVLGVRCLRTAKGGVGSSTSRGGNGCPTHRGRGREAGGARRERARRRANQSPPRGPCPAPLLAAGRTPVGRIGATGAAPPPAPTRAAG